MPTSSETTPDGVMLESFLSQDIWPIPTKYANTKDKNPWESQIESYLGRDLANPPAEGRPPPQSYCRFRAGRA